MFEEGRRLGVRGMVATHGMAAPTSLTVEQAQRAGQLGAFIEFTSGTLATPNAQVKVDRLANDIRKVGIEHAILSSDLGQAGNPLPADGYATYIEALRKKASRIRNWIAWPTEPRPSPGTSVVRESKSHGGCAQC